MTAPLNLAPNNPPMPTGWEPVWMLPTTPPSWPKPIDLPADDEEKEYDFPYPHCLYAMRDSIGLSHSEYRGAIPC